MDLVIRLHTVFNAASWLLELVVLSKNTISAIFHEYWRILNLHKLSDVLD